MTLNLANGYGLTNALSEYGRTQNIFNTSKMKHL